MKIMVFPMLRLAAAAPLCLLASVVVAQNSNPQPNPYGATTAPQSQQPKP